MSDQKSWKTAIAPVLWSLITILAVACASTEKDEPVGPDRYVLENGPIIVAGSPFPNQHPIYAKLYAGEKLLERRLAYRGWDLDHDGKIDMLEYLDAEGRVLRKTYDFNRDGIIDTDHR